MADCKKLAWHFDWLAFQKVNISQLKDKGMFLSWLDGLVK